MSKSRVRAPRVALEDAQALTRRGVGEYAVHNAGNDAARLMERVGTRAWLPIWWMYSCLQLRGCRSSQHSMGIAAVDACCQVRYSYGKIQPQLPLFPRGKWPALGEVFICQRPVSSAGHHPPSLTNTSVCSGRTSSFCYR